VGIPTPQPGKFPELAPEAQPASFLLPPLPPERDALFWKAGPKVGVRAGDVA
jgi:hypothetical protein